MSIYLLLKQVFIKPIWASKPLGTPTHFATPKKETTHRSQLPRYLATFLNNLIKKVTRKQHKCNTLKKCSRNAFLNDVL